MRIVFMGTPGFARESLTRLYSDGHDVAAVFTQPDKPRNRGMKLSYSPVKELALEHGTPMYQPATLRDGESARLLRGFNCDLIAVVAYGRLLPREILEIPRFGCVNIHSSLLPKYRGAAPIQRAILNGERETGVTSMFMVEELDAGDMIFTKKTAIGDEETAAELFERLGVIGAQLLSETVKAIAAGNAPRAPQIQSDATFAPPLQKELSPIDWTDRAYNIKCKVRGLNPWPIATAEFNGVIFKVFSVDIRVDDSSEVSGKAPGTVLSAGSHGLEVACADGAIIIRELQAPGGKRMKAADYLKGHKI